MPDVLGVAGLAQELGADVLAEAAFEQDLGLDQSRLGTVVEADVLPRRVALGRLVLEARVDAGHHRVELGSAQARGPLWHRPEAVLRGVYRREEAVVEVTELHAGLHLARGDRVAQVDHARETAVLVLERFEEEAGHDVIGLDGLLRVEDAPPFAVRVLVHHPSAERVQEAERAPSQLGHVNLHPVAVLLRVGQLAGPVEHLVERPGHPVRQTGLEKEVLAIEERNEVRADREAPDVLMARGRRRAPFLHVGTGRAVGAFAPHDVPTLLRDAFGYLPLEALALLKLREVSLESHQVPVADVDLQELLEVLVQRVEELVADVGVGLPEVDVHDVLRDVAGDLHQGDHVHRAPRDRKSGRRDGAHVREALPEDLDGAAPRNRTGVRPGELGYAPRAKDDGGLCLAGRRDTEQPAQQQPEGDGEATHAGHLSDRGPLHDMGGKRNSYHIRYNAKTNKFRN